MLLRISYILLAVVAVILGYNIFQLYTVYGALDDIPVEYTAGPADADLTVVEFLDYNCEYCREVHPTITEALKKDGKIRYIPRPLPSENPESVHAAILAYSAAGQGKFIEMHNEVIRNFRVIDEEVLGELAQKTGLDGERLTATIEKDSEKIRQQILENGRLFARLGLNATPTFVIDGKYFYTPEGRMPAVDDFLKMFADARQRKKQELP